MERVCIVGAGYVGLCTGLALAEHGHHVTLADVVAEKIQQIRQGQAPFFEPGVAQALARATSEGRLEATTDVAGAVGTCDFTFLCVGTPQGKDGAVDLSYIRSAARTVGQALKSKTGYHVVIVKSTVVPGTTEETVVPKLEAASGKRAGPDFGAASNPEFLKEGSALADALRPDRIVVGATDARAAERVWKLYEGLSCPKLTTNPRTAEMIKYAANAFLATKIAFSDEMANVCERIGVDWYTVVQGIGSDARIGPLFLRAGVGFGGSCFPKDLAALAHVARSVGAPSSLLESVQEHNEHQPHVAVRMLKEELTSLRGRRIALLGLAFKPDTDDVRETRALPLLRALLAEGARVVAYDPQAMDNFRKIAPEIEYASSLDACLRGAEGAVVQTEWKEFREVAPQRFKELMKTPVVVDGRRTFDPEQMSAAGIRYRAIGLGRPPRLPPKAVSSGARAPGRNPR